MDEVKIYILHAFLIKDNFSFISSFVDKKEKKKQNSENAKKQKSAEDNWQTF